MVSGNPFKFVLVNLSLYADLIWTGIRCQGYESTNPKDSHGFLNDLQDWEFGSFHIKERTKGWNQKLLNMESS